MIPHHSKSNRKVESAVKVAKKLLRKCRESVTDTYLAMLELRNTPSHEIGSIPVQRLYNRRTRTLLPATANLLKPSVQSPQVEHSKMCKQQKRQAKYYDKHAKNLPKLSVGDTVRIKPVKLGEKVRKKCIITRSLDDCSYNVVTSDGAKYRRNMSI